MRSIIKKSPIPENKSYVIQKLHSSYFDPNIHSHPEFQLFFVLEGRGTRFIGDSIKPFQEGDIVFTGPHLPHLWKSDDAYFKKSKELSTSGIVLYLREDFLGEAVNQKEELEVLNLLFTKSLRGLEITGNTNKIIGKLMLELLELKGLPGIIRVLEILNVIASSFECTPITHHNYDTSDIKSEGDRMNKVYEYVMKNFRQKISLNEVAGIINMTPTSFCRFFKARVNKSFSDFVKEIRIEYSCKLLNEEKITISQISFECGFNTLSNFNKQFRLLTGENPLTYRKRYQKVSAESMR
ncbi:MAG TPA: AraC family transcriptional regulator [Pedobacter sp.]